MKRAHISDLPEVFQKCAEGLSAPAEWKQRIRLEAAKRKLCPAPRRPLSWRPTAVASLAMAAVLLLVVFLPLSNGNRPVQQLIRPIIAGNGGSEPTADPSADPKQAMLTLVSGDVGVGASVDGPKYRSLWASGKDGIFPLIGVNGKYYRMMTSPKSVSNSLLGSQLGVVTEFTTDPALSDGRGIISNVATMDSTVYGIPGMDNTLVAAEVDGQMRVFQRVSFNGQALLQGETLADTLQASGMVTSMSISDMGVVTDSATITSLLNTLFTNASYQSGSGLRANQALHLELSNGLTLQMTIKKGKLGACGTWACQEFLDAFASSVEP